MTENAQVYSTLKTAGLISIKTAVSLALEKGGTALDQELTDIKADAKAVAPVSPNQTAPLNRLSQALNKENGQTNPPAQ
jgi:hypothetical protein